MTIKEIEKNIGASFGITELNPMQYAMAAARAPYVILLAPTGSGKTIAFALYLLQRLSAPRAVTQAVVLAPSRELVLQIHSVLRPIATGYKVSALYGGHSMVEEVKSLSVVPDVIVATPGRLLDHLQRGTLSLNDVPLAVFDEYDKILELGFEREMQRIHLHLHSLGSVVLTSATRLRQFPAFLSRDKFDVLDFIPATHGRRPVDIVQVPSALRDKLQSLIDLIHSLPNGKVIVFVNHRESVERVYDALKRAGFPVGMYHGAMEQRQRAQAVNLLDNGTTPILVSTDLAARGLDIDQVQSVIHYHLPVSPEAWTHRNGRTGRQDADGTVYVITSEADNLPDYFHPDRQLIPSGISNDPIHTDTSTLYFNLGKKEKISRGDIAGFLIKSGELKPDQIGRIVIDDHSAIAAVPTAELNALLQRLSQARLKNQRVRVTPLKP